MSETTYPHSGHLCDDWPETAVPSALHTMETSLGPLPHLSLRSQNHVKPEALLKSDRYAILGEIARGGMGAVLHGHDSDLNRDLAIKVLLEGHRDNPDLLRRFVEEAQIGGQLQHPGIVPIYELGRFADQRPFFAMKLVKGRTLADLLKEREFPGDDLPRFLKIFVQICETMAYAHSRGVIHRDLKPMNIMVGAFGEVQVMDWGLAKVLGRVDTDSDSSHPKTGCVRTVRSDSADGHTELGAFLGTAAYMPPEQARGDMEHLDERADVFALGSMLCQILTGYAAYTGRSAQEVSAKAVVADLTEAQARLDDCGAEPELVAIAARCLAPDPEKRPRDASEVAALINAYLSGVQDRLRAAEMATVEATARAEHEQKARLLTEAKAIQERRAKRLTIALAGAILLGGVIGGSAWHSYNVSCNERLSQTELIVGHALSQAEALHAEAKRSGNNVECWVRAMDAAEKAGDLLSGRLARPGLQNRVDLLLKEVTDELTRAREQSRRADIIRGLVTKLEESRLDIGNRCDNPFDYSAKIAAYIQAFREVKVDVETIRPEYVATLPLPSEDRERIAAVLDDWMTREPEPAKRDRLDELARALDPDPFRNQLRDAIASRDCAAVINLAERDRGNGLPVSSICLLAEALVKTGNRDWALNILHQVQRQNPGEFWINHDLGALLSEGTRAEQQDAVPFLMAALALRPNSPGARRNLNFALRDQGKFDWKKAEAK